MAFLGPPRGSPQGWYLVLTDRCWFRTEHSSGAADEGETLEGPHGLQTSNGQVATAPAPHIQ